MLRFLEKVDTPLFAGIDREDLKAVLGCTGYFLASYRKGDPIALEEERIVHVGILLSGAVDMVKEDVWGNRTLLHRAKAGAVFGETFACGVDPRSVVSFLAAEDTEVLFLPFHKTVRTCEKSCRFHQTLVENMLKILAEKNRELLFKIEVVSQKSLREKLLAYLSQQSRLAGARYFQIPLGRQELAEFLCADRSALTRELSRMKSEGLIDFEKNWFRIL